MCGFSALPVGVASPDRGECHCPVAHHVANHPWRVRRPWPVALMVGPMRSANRRPPRSIFLLVVLCSSLYLGACGEDDQPATSDTTRGPDVCAARADLAASIDSLRNIDILADGTDAFRASLSDVGDALGALASEASDDLADELDVVRRAVDALDESVPPRDDGTPAGEAVGAVSGALEELSVAVDDLTAELDRDCDAP